MKTFEIFFDDLNEEAKIELLSTFETNEKDENWEDTPLAAIDRITKYEDVE